MRKGKSMLVKRRASKKEQHEGQSTASIFLELQMVKSGWITDRSQATRHVGAESVYCAVSTRSKLRGIHLHVFVPFSLHLLMLGWKGH